MKIVIKADGVRLRLWFPLSILKSRIGYNVAVRTIEQNARKHADKTEQNLKLEVVQNTEEQIGQKVAQEIPLNREQMTEIYNVLKRYVKEHGHFNIIEVKSHEGEEVLIRV